MSNDSDIKQYKNELKSLLQTHVKGFRTMSNYQKQKIKKNFMNDVFYDEKLTNNEEVNMKIIRLILLIRNSNRSASVKQFKDIETTIYEIENNPSARQTKRVQKLKKNLKDMKVQIFRNRSKVSCLELKNINLFERKRQGYQYIYPGHGYISIDDLQLFLDPAWGSVWSIAAAKNHYNFGIINPIRSTLNILFSMPSFSPLHISKFVYLYPSDVGYLLGFLYDMLHSLNKLKKTKMSDVEKGKIVDAYCSNIKNKMLTSNFSYKTCSIETDEKKTMEHCDTVGIPEFYIEKRIREYKKCLKKKKNCSKKIEYNEIQNKNQCKNIIRYFLQLFLEKGIHRDIVYFFHGILCFLWCSASNKKGILEYYVGLKQFDVLHNTSYFKNVQIPSLNMFTQDVFTVQEFDKIKNNESDELKIISYLIYMTEGDVKLNTYNNNVQFYSTSFPDCGETALRNFFKLALYDENTLEFNVYKLETMKASEKLIEYFRIFNQDSYFETFEKLSNVLENRNMELKYWDIQKDGSKNAITAWSDVVQNLKHVDYKNSIIVNNMQINFEIKAGKHSSGISNNMFVVLQQLFPTHFEIQNSTSLKDILNMILDGKKSSKKYVGQDHDVKSKVNREIHECESSSSEYSDDVHYRSLDEKSEYDKSEHDKSEYDKEDDENSEDNEEEQTFDDSTGLGYIIFEVSSVEYKFMFRMNHFYIEKAFDSKISFSHSLKELYLEKNKWKNSMFTLIDQDNIGGMFRQIRGSMKEKTSIKTNIIKCVSLSSNEDLINRVFNNILIEERTMEDLKPLFNKITSISSMFGSLLDVNFTSIGHHQFEKLHEVNLSSNDLFTIPKEIRQFKQLKVLQLDNCPLIFIPKEIGQLTQLETLNIEKNKLTSLPTEIGDLKNLKKLYLHQNKLRSLPAEIGQLIELNEFDVSSNQLTSLPIEIGNLRSLTRWLIYNNYLTSLPNTISRLSQLKYFALENNRLSSISKEIGELQNLKVFFISRMELKHLPKEMGKLVNLKRLEMQECNLSSLPIEMTQLSKLRTFNVNNNNIKNLSQFMVKLFKNSRRLRYLRINDNKLSNLPDTICGLTCLQHLEAQNNELVSLPKNFGELKHIVKLFLNDNKITKMPDVLKMPFLEELTICDNKINHIPDNILTHRRLQILNLSGNSLNQTSQELQDKIKKKYKIW